LPQDLRNLLSLLESSSSGSAWLGQVQAALESRQLVKLSFFHQVAGYLALQLGLGLDDRFD